MCLKFCSACNKLQVKDAEIKEKEKPRLSKSEAEGGTKASKGG